MLHQLYAVHAPFVEIENHTSDEIIYINGDRFYARGNGRLAVPCSAGETLDIRWNDQQTGVLCQTRLYIGL